MGSLTDLFAAVLSMGWTALPVMAVVLGVRLALRRSPRKYVYLLWAVVAFRLVCPVTISTPVGLVAPETARQQLAAVQEAVETPAPEWEPGPQADDAPQGGGAAPVTAPPFAAAPVRRAADPMAVLTAVWLGGMAAAAGYVLWSVLHLRRMVRTAVRREGNVWECDSLPTPFVLGLLRPRIYIPFRMEEAERAYVLAHEREHLRWRDQWVKALFLGILTVYWWHPGVWLCWILLCRDMELRCDEAVLASLGDGIKAEYSRSLLSFALDRRFPAALAFGEHDAARRVRHVLDWKQAKPAAVFLALAAVILATAVCGTNAAGHDSWIHLSRGRNALGPAGACSYRISEAYQSYLLYQERYDHGELTSRELLAYGTFGQGPEATPRRGSFTLELDEEPLGDGTSRYRQFWWRGCLNGGAEVRFGGVPSGIYGEAGWAKKRRDLGEDTAVALAAIAENGTGTVNGLNVPEGLQPSERTLENDIVLVLRLRLSRDSEDALAAAFEAFETEPNPLDTLAPQLYYAERTPEAILDLLGAEETLGRYTVEDSPHSYLSLLFYDCPEPLPDRDTTLWKYSMVLLALLEDYQETTWNWIDGGVQVRETNGGLWNTRSWLNAHGLGKPIREYGASPEALRLLLGTLYPEYGGGAAVSETGQALYALGNDLELLMKTLAEPALGEISWHFTEGGILEIAPAASLSGLQAADGGEGILSDLSCLLLALTTNEEVWSIRWLDGGEPVEFSYLHSGDQFMENAAAIWTEHRSGEILDIRACGRGPAGMTLLAEDLGVERFLDMDALRTAAEAKSQAESLTHTAAQLYALSTEESADELIDDLVCRALWGDASLSGKYRQTMEQGTLLLEFPTDGGDGERMDQRMARNAAVLLRLRPEISAVRWTYPYGDGAAERTFDTGALSSVLLLSSNTAVYRQPQSAQDIQALLHFLSSLDDRVFTSALEGRDIPRQTPFTDILGYDGFIWDLQEGFFRSRTWYAVEEGREPFPIAGTYGYDPPQVWELDLDGDGQKELICNYVTGGDGHPGVSIYQRREDGVYEGRLSTENLPGHDNWGLNSSTERYEPESERFVITYDAGNGQQREAVFTYAEALARMEWYPSFDE